MGETSVWVDRLAVCKAFSRRVVIRSPCVALIVGSILNIINQGTEMLAGEHINLIQLSLPLLVATYGSYSAFRQVDIFNARAEHAND